MKKSVSTGEGAVVAPRRFNGWGILAASLALATLIFLVVGPMVERNAHLEALDDLEDRERLKRGLLMLCNTQANIVHLNAQLEQKSLEERKQITKVASALDCIKRLKPSLQAEYYLWNGAKGDVAQVAAQGNQAIEPAIEALESDEIDIKHRAARALIALSRELNADHRLRIERRLDDDDLSTPINALRLELGLPIPEIPSDEVATPVVEVPVIPDEDEVWGAEEDMAVDLDDMALELSDAGENMEEDMAQEQQEDVDAEDKLGMPAPPSGLSYGQGAFRLREPSLQIKGPKVLYAPAQSP